MEYKDIYGGYNNLHKWGYTVTYSICSTLRRKSIIRREFRIKVVI